MGSTESTLPPMEGGTSNRNHAARLGRESDPSGGETSSDDPWWWEIEHQDLVLDHTPNVTSESASVELSANFDTFLSNAEDANVTLNNNGNNNNSDVSGDLDGSESANVGASAVDVTVNFTLKKPIARCSKSNESEDTFNETHKGHGDHVNDEISQSLDEFKEELHQKRLARQAAVQELRDEITALRKQLTAEQMLTRRLRQSDNAAVGEVGSVMASSTLKNCTEGVKNTEDSSTDLMDAVDVSDLTDSTDLTAVTNATAMDEDDRNVCSRSRHANIELANAQLALQLATSENLSLRTELGVTKKQVGTLKEVVACCKQMLAMKEEQCEQLKIKLSEIEESFGEREAKMMSDNLREEYERQLGNIRQLRQLYEERQRIAAAEQENLQRLISMKRDELAAEQERTKSFEERNQALMKEVETANKELATLREECNEHKFEKKALKEEMGAVNTLFSQMVMGFNGKNNLDIDRLATMLEENRTLLNDMATKEVNCGDGATLPKLLFELVEQAAVDCKVGSRSSTPPTDASDGGGEEQTERCGTEKALMDAAATRPEDESSDVAAEQQAKQEVEVGNEQDAISNSYSNSNNKEEEQEEENVNGCTTNNNNNYNTSKKPQHHHHHRKSVASRMKISATSAAADATSSTVKFNEPEILGHVASTQEIIGNLPKVWRVLMELLSHHRVEQVQFEENGAGEDCYKSVETPNGPKTELSVSKTYIKLKDLILEKKSLVKETNRLKMLNSHLDYHLNEQEKRLSAVSLELTKTWHLVGKMQRQHRQLHTQEQILRYQLQQKRRLLTELKDELEYCRRKWAAARAKNDESQEQCNDLRREFAKRKLEDANHSAESGYSDSGPASDEESGRPALGESAEEESVCCRRNLLQMFEHSRKIKRMQSTSPGRAAYVAAAAGSEVLLRGSSAPPTCGWYAAGDDEDDVSDVGEDRDESEETATDGDDESAVGVPKPLGQAHGAIPKEGLRLSRSKQCIRRAANIDVEVLAAGEEEVPSDSDAVQPSSAAPNAAHVVCIQRLEEQCKSLIQQMMQTSDNRERLEVQLCRFQDAIAPVQYARPLDDSMTQKRLERMTRASSAPASAAGTLTPREEEYTRKRSERLERLEEESRQLISRIKRTSDRGHYLRCSLERLHKTRNGGGGGGGGGGAAGEGCSSAISREGSFESNTEDEEEAVATVQSVAQKDSSADAAIQTESPLTAAEEAYTARRAERLKRLEAESKELLTQLTRSTQRGSELGNQLDVLHEQHGSKEGEPIDKMPTATSASSTFEHRLENIERISSNRAERLRILEEEGKQLISRLSSTSERGTRMINRIAEREQSRAARHNEAAADERLTAEAATPSPQNNDNAEAEQEEDVSAASVSGAAAPLLPTLKSVACSSIVSEELAECVTVTTTTSRIASGSQIQGAVPKSRPLAQLSVAANVKSKPSTSAGSSSAGESLEEMVNRLRSLPFPDSESAQPQKCTDSEVAESEGKDGRQKSESGST